MIAKETQQRSYEAVQIRLSLEGNLEAFCDLVRPYRRGLCMKALSIVGCEADAEDVAQNSLLKAIIRLSQFRHQSQFRTWLTSITINEARMWLRANRCPNYEYLDDEQHGGEHQAMEIPDLRETPFQVLERKQIRHAILKALALLPALYRRVFILRDLQQLSISETARTLGISETKVKTRLRRGRLRGRSRIRQFRPAPIGLRRMLSLLAFRA